MGLTLANSLEVLANCSRIPKPAPCTVLGDTTDNSFDKIAICVTGLRPQSGSGLRAQYYNLHLTQALRGLARVKTERIAGRQQVRGVPKTAC